MIRFPALRLLIASETFWKNANFLVEVFPLLRPLNSVGLNYFKEPRSLFAARKGDGCMKDTEHPVRHPRVHLPDRASARRKRGCARQEAQFGRGMAPSWAGATPFFATCSWRKNRGVAPAQQMEAGIHMKRVRRGAQRESGRNL